MERRQAPYPEDFLQWINCILINTECTEIGKMERLAGESRTEPTELMLVRNRKSWPICCMISDKMVINNLHSALRC